MTHNKKQISLSNLLINCISARSAPQIFFIKGESTFRFCKFLMIGLCNSSANSLLDTSSFLIADSFCVARVAKVSTVRSLTVEV